jgi:hypothetical protein
MITTTHLTTKKEKSTGNNQSFESLLGAHGIKSTRAPRFIISMNPSACEKWLRQVAACDQVVDGWILRNTAERFVYLNPLSEVWEKLQQFTQKQNFRVPEGYTYLLHQASLQQSVAMAPAQMLGLQLKDGQVTSVASLNVLPLNERPFRNIRVYPEDIVTSALQAMSLLAGGFTCPVKMFHCLPDGLTPGQLRIIRNLFKSLSVIFTSSGFEVSMVADPVSHFLDELAA